MIEELPVDPALDSVVVWRGVEPVVRLTESTAETLLDDVALIDNVAGNAEAKVLLIAIEFDSIPDITLEMPDGTELDAVAGTEIAWVTLLEGNGSDA